MTMLTHSEMEIEFDFDPCVVAAQLCRGVQPAEEMEACRSVCDAIGREFAEAAFQLLSSGTLGAAFSAFERQVMTASQACVRAVLKAGIESLDDGARHVFRGGRRHRRVQATPRTVMTSAGPVEYSRSRYRSESGAAIMPVDEQVCFAGGLFHGSGPAEQGVFLMSALSPRDCVSLYGRFGIDGASVSSLQRLTADAGRRWSGCADDALVAMRAGEAIPAQGGERLHLPRRDHASHVPGGERWCQANDLERGVRRDDLLLRCSGRPLAHRVFRRNARTPQGNPQAAAGGGTCACHQAPARFAACCRRRRGRRQLALLVRPGSRGVPN